MRRLGVVGIALLGLWAMLEAFSMILMNLQLTSGSGSDTSGITYSVVIFVVPAALFFIAGFLLVWFRRALATRWFEDEPLDVALDAVPLLRVGLILLGIALATMALGQVFAGLIRPFMVAASDRAQFGADATPAVPFLLTLAAQSGAFARLIIGLALVGFSLPLSAWLLRPQIRPAATQTELRTCPTCSTPYDPSDYRTDGTALCAQCGGPLDAGDA